MQRKYKNTPKHVGYALLAGLLLMAANLSFAQDSNSVTAVSGYVTITSSDGSTRRAKIGEELVDGDTISTGEDSTATIVLADGTVINLGELSSYTIGSENNDDSPEVGVGGDGYGEGDPSTPGSGSTGAPALSTATSAGGGLSDGPPGGSPTN